MSNYRADQYLTSLEKLYEQRNQSEDDPQLIAENTIQDLFFPVSEKLALTDKVDVAYFTPATFCWGSGRSVSASSPSDWGSRSNVTL